MNNLQAVENKTKSAKQPLVTLLKGWIISNNDQFTSHLSTYISQWSNAKFISMTNSEVEQTLSQLKESTTPDLILMDGKDDWQTLIVSLKQVLKENSRIPDIVLLVDHADTIIMRQALKFGVKDVLTIPFGEEELDQVFFDCATLKKSDVKLGEISIFINAKGGMGASIIATTVAHMVTLQHTSPPVLIDTDAQFGCIPNLLSTNPKFILSDALEQTDDLDEYALQGLLSKHKSGLRFIASRKDKLFDTIPTHSPLAFNQFLTKLRANFEHIIIDMSRGIEKFTLPALSEAEYIFIVVQQNVPAIREAANLIKQLKHLLGINDKKFKIIVNRYSKKIEITSEEIKKSLHIDELILVPNDFQSVSASTNLGELLATHSSKQPIIKGMRAISNIILNKNEKKLNGIERLFSFIRN
ncbi:MAG: AAA family ATPase [Photobacterium frigidiphilum]|uniref:AAA family ATPase n=1 Tax=Photobacterium frigidiphilum TaxID=264736 RepID=UPI003002D3ED